MNIIKRTCATCVAFNPLATGEEVVCGNLTFFTVDRGTPHAVNPTRQTGALFTRRTLKTRLKILLWLGSGMAWTLNRDSGPYK